MYLGYIYIEREREGEGEERERERDIDIFKLGFTQCKTEQLLQGIELREKERQKD